MLSIDKDTKRIGVTGPHGRLGSELIAQGCQPIVVDVTNYHALKTAVESADCDVIIHCAAKTDVDDCELHPQAALTINTCSVYNLLTAYSGKVVYISTDFIFDGKSGPRGPYCEDWPPSPLSIYGLAKLGGELLIRNSGRANDLIVRTTVLFDGKSGCFVDKVLTKLLRDEYVYVPDDLYGSPTYIPHLAQDILMAIENQFTGVINLAGAYVLSRYHFARIIARLADVPVALVRRSGPRTEGAPRPRNAGLATNKATNLGFPIRDPLEPIAQIIAERKENAK